MAESHSLPIERLQDTSLPVLEHHVTSLNEKTGSTDEKDSGSEVADARDGYIDPEKINSDKESIYSDTVLVNGDPVITSGKDVSRFVVDLRDDGDASLTFRSVVLGTIFAGLGAAVYQVGCLML